MLLCVFIAILVPKLVAIVTPLCPLCTGVSRMNSLIAHILSQNQTLHGYIVYNWSYGHFCEILGYFGQSLVAMATSLRPWNQKCLLWIGRLRKPPVISNHVLIIYHRNAFMCIYSNFSPKIGCHGNAPLPLVYGSVIDEFPCSTNPISKPNYAWICSIQLKLWPFLWYFGLFWPKFCCHGNPLDPCNQKCLHWIGRPLKPYVEPKILPIAVTQAKLCRFEGSRQV